MRFFAAVLAVALAAPTPAREAPTLIDTAALKARMNGPPASWHFTLIDARTAVEFSEGHIPGAILVPATRVAELLPKVVRDRSRTIVFYCNGPNCTKSVKAGKAAIALGYSDVVEYKEGLPGWGKAAFQIEGKPLPKIDAPTIAPAALQAALSHPNGPFVIDIRDAEEFASFHLAQAKSVPIDDIAKSVKSFPPGRPIVIVDHAGHQTPVAARLLASLGRTDVKRLDGGLLRWQQQGLPLAIR